jgi:NAD(P)-dependent dehydrogenase (short-subunit alcohol dehydrogenase family)
MARLARRRALVIGAATGIGREVCRLFAREGAALAIADLGQAEAKASLLAELAPHAQRAIALEVDVTHEAAVAGTVTAAVEGLGGLDILVNNAGVGGPMSEFHTQDAAEWRRVMAVNFCGVAYGMRHALPHMLAQRYGRIINTASQLAHKPSAGNAIYCASKAAVVALTASVAQEVATRGVTVNAICPGPTDTAMWRSSDPEWNRRKLDSLPIGRVGRPEEIAWAYVYLASDEAAYMVGQSVSPNGGDVMW